MSLINGDEANFCSVDHRNEAFVIEAFGRYIPMKCQHRSPHASASGLDLRLRGMKRKNGCPVVGKETLPTYSNFNSSLRNLSQVSSQASRLWDESMAAAATPRFFKAST